MKPMTFHFKDSTQKKLKLRSAKTGIPMTEIAELAIEIALSKKIKIKK